MTIALWVVRSVALFVLIVAGVAFNAAQVASPKPPRPGLATEAVASTRSP